MEKFNYTVSIEAPSKEIADNLMSYFFRKDSIPLSDVLKEEVKKENKTERRDPSSDQKKETENFMKAILQFEKAIQIIDRCVNDPSAIDKIAQLLGINVEPIKTAA